MRITFKLVEKLGRDKGLQVERSGKQIEIWAETNHGVTAVCESVREAYDTVGNYDGKYL